MLECDNGQYCEARGGLRSLEPITCGKRRRFGRCAVLTEGRKFENSFPAEKVEVASEKGSRRQARKERKREARHEKRNGQEEQEEEEVRTQEKEEDLWNKKALGCHGAVIDREKKILHQLEFKSTTDQREDFEGKSSD
jgi:hypothetical protein